MRRVRLTIEVGPAGDPEQVLAVDVEDLHDAALLQTVPLQWTWKVEGVEMRMTAEPEDTPDDQG